MSATRLLILGVLRIKQPTHGYEVRRELESWNAEQWANIAYGSIYYALNKMAKEGLVQTVERSRSGKGPARTVYAVTRQGEAEFQRLLREFWWQPKPVIDPFQVALTFMSELPLDELLAALKHRAAVARTVVGIMADKQSGMEQNGIPRHVMENFRLVTEHYVAELRWAEEATDRVKRGDLP